MKILAWFTLALALVAGVSGGGATAAGPTLVKVGWCTRTISSTAAPFAIATKMGWYEQAGIKVQLVPLAGSTDCLKQVATGDLPFSFPSPEGIATIRAQGVRAKIFYTALQSNIYGIAVPADGPIRSIGDLKGKSIGVASMASAAVHVTRALLALNGLDPEKDARIVVSGEAAQAAALVRSKQIDAVATYDVMFALIESAGQPLRRLDTGPLARFPSNSFFALEDTLQSRRANAVALARGYAMGTAFALANPQAAVRILYEIHPEVRQSGKTENESVQADAGVLLARAPSWRLPPGRRWGESSLVDYDAYEDFLVRWGVVGNRLPAADLVTNALLDEVNAFDAGAIAARAKTYR